ncbi:MAG: hypothetical protein GY757_39015, partial [bacterium]|nr:hypothetical protein [bacterium]
TSHWTSVNWDAWGLEAEKKEAAGNETNRFTLYMTPKEGVTVFKHLLTWPKAHQVIVSTGDLDTRLRQWVKHEVSQKEDGETVEDATAFQPRPPLANAYVEPGNQLEKQIAGYWGKFFGIRQVGIHDDFFELGGDSLKATTVIGKLHRDLSVKVPLTEFFRKPTVKGITEFVKGLAKEKLTAIKPVEKKEHYPLSSAQKRVYVQYLLDKQVVNYNLPEIVLLEGTFDSRRAVDIFDILTRRHESFRTSFQMLDETLIQVIHPTVDSQIENDETNEENVPEKIKRFIRPFDLSVAPLLRVGLLKLEEKKRILMLDMHHIISDDTSIGIMVREFLALYGGEKLTPLEIQYKEFVQWENNFFATEEFKKQAAYWLERFSGPLPALELPTDFPRPPVQRYEGGNFSFEIGDELTGALKELAEKSGATLYMVLLAIVTALLSKYTGQEDISVGTRTAGRSHVALTGIIGMFINTLVMRNYPAKDKTFLQFLEEVRFNALQAFDNQDYQFNDLLERLKIKRDRSRNPLYDVVFAFLNVEQPDIKIQDLSLEHYQWGDTSSQIDLRFGGTEKDNKIQFNITYSTSLFKESYAEKMAERFIDIVKQVVENDQIKLAELKLSHELLTVKSKTRRQHDEGFDF